MASSSDIQIYRGHVGHKRLRPRQHALRYAVFSFLADVDRLDGAGGRSLLFAYNRWAVFSLFDKDFGPRDGTPIADHARNSLRQAGYECADWSIKILAYPRVMGYAFNPLSVYYCSDAQDVLRAMIYEVTNTFGERCCYVVDAGAATNGVFAHHCTKKMYVSPFAAVTGGYDFRVTPPCDELTVGVMFRDPEGPLIKTYFRGQAQPFSTATLIKLALIYPLMTLKVVAGIHWEALRLWLKGVPVVRRLAVTRFFLSPQRSNNERGWRHD